MAQNAVEFDLQILVIGSECRDHLPGTGAERLRKPIRRDAWVSWICAWMVGFVRRQNRRIVQHIQLHESYY